MSKAAYWQRGEAIDYINKTEETIEVGTVMALGRHIGIAASDIPPGEKGVIHVEGVFEFPKGEEAIEVGDDVYLNTAVLLTQMQALAVPSANAPYNSTVKDRTYIGYATENAPADAETVFVKINA